MRIFAIITVLFCAIGCSTTSTLQCDEVYMSDYNCNLPQRNIYTPTYNTYRDYYPNTQTIYYVPVYIPTPVTPPTEQKPTRTGPRPGNITRSTGRSD